MRTSGAGGTDTVSSSETDPTKPDRHGIALRHAVSDLTTS